MAAALPLPRGPYCGPSVPVVGFGPSSWLLMQHSSDCRLPRVPSPQGSSRTCASVRVVVKQPRGQSVLLAPGAALLRFSSEVSASGGAEVRERDLLPESASLLALNGVRLREPLSFARPSDEASGCSVHGAWAREKAMREELLAQLYGADPVASASPEAGAAAAGEAAEPSSPRLSPLTHWLLHGDDLAVFSLRYHVAGGVGERADEDQGETMVFEPDFLARAVHIALPIIALPSSVDCGADASESVASAAPTPTCSCTEHALAARVRPASQLRRGVQRELVCSFLDERSMWGSIYVLMPGGGVALRQA